MLGTHSDHLDLNNSDPSPCLALWLQIPECLKKLFGFLILPIPLLVLPSLKFLQIPGDVAMFFHINLNDIAFKIQN